ncbi:MAG: TrkH family potassium uptake protein [Thermoplasmata archaeon]|nr:MAG: TrkH family potassium uptake protein [Thermoplasmata archaeon]HDN96240.1 TrkH family potassium uptake protein [Thermoplasmatales archaeon]
MKNLKIVLRDTGAVLIAVGIIINLVNFVCIIYGEFDSIKWYILTSLTFLGIGALFRFAGKCDHETKIRHAMITAALSWLIISLISSIPFYFIVKIDFLSSFFEAVSGWTGTGLTMFSHPSQLPHSIQFWRSFIQWVGGVGVIVLTLVILARPGTGSFTLYRSEAREEKIHPSIISTVKTIWWIYLLYTVIGIIALLIAGIPAWEAINHCMTAIATGGFSIKDDSMASYPTFIQILLVPMMVAGAIAFSTHYELLKGRIKNFFKDVQTQALLFLLFIGTIALTYININDGSYSSFAISFKYSAFQYISALTCTGFSTVNIASWGEEAKLLLSLAMIAGGAAGSTAGGIKLFRIILLAKGVGWKVRRIFLPVKGTFAYKLGGKVLGKEEAIEEISEAAIVSFLWAILLVVGIFIVMHSTGADLSNAVFEVCSAQGNVGLSAGITAINMNPMAKFMLILNMWVGRLEIIPILILLRAIVKGGKIV